MKWRSVLNDLHEYHPGKKLPDTVKLSSNENPLGPSPRALQAFRGLGGELSLYPPVISAELARKIADKRGLGQDQVIVGNGSDEILTLICASLIEPGDNCIGGRHCFSQYEFSTTLFGGKFRAIDMTDFQFDLDAMAAAIDSRTKVIFLCSPNNPTGMAIDHEDLQHFLAKLPSDVAVVLDQAYWEFSRDADPSTATNIRQKLPDAASLIGRFPNLVVTGTFSKLYGLASFRIGYGLADPSFISQLHKAKSPFNVNGPALQAALAALDDGEFEERSLAFNSQGMKTLRDALDAAGIRYLPSQANFLCVKCPKGDAQSSVMAIQRRGISVRNLASFGMPEWIRVTIGTPVQMNIIAQALVEERDA